MMVYEMSIIICDGNRRRNFCREILIGISGTLLSLSNMNDFIHENCGLGIIYLFNMIRVMALFGLKGWKSVNLKF